MPKLSVLPVPWVPLPLYLCQSWPQLPFRTNKNGKCSKQTLKQLTHIVTLCQIMSIFCQMFCQMLAFVCTKFVECESHGLRFQVAEGFPVVQRLLVVGLDKIFCCYGSVTVLLRFSYGSYQLDYGFGLHTSNTLSPVHGVPGVYLLFFLVSVSSQS
jgi:hypothetical protein